METAELVVSYTYSCNNDTIIDWQNNRRQN